MTNNYIEYSIKIKDEQNTFSQKDILYQSLLLGKENFELQTKIKELVDQFYQGNLPEEPPSIVVTAKLIWES